MDANVSLINVLTSWLGFANSACHFDQLFQLHTNCGYGHGPLISWVSSESCKLRPCQPKYDYYYYDYYYYNYIFRLEKDMDGEEEVASQTF